MGAAIKRRMSGLTALLLLMSHMAQAALPLAVEGEELPSLAPMLERVTPAVVNIATEGRVQLRQNPLLADPFFQQFFNLPNQPMERKTQSLGSGVIVDAKRGLVLTNNHVIANAVQITVTLRDGRQLAAEIIGTDPDTDVALIRIPAENLAELKAANSDALRVGDFVVAIGNPFGLGQTVTSGIVSALSRSGLGIEDYEDFIQTDASINPGNSGGALVNLRGELVGINTAIISGTGGNIGIGLAIPINLAMQITSQLLDKGKVERGYIGLKLQDLNAELADAFNLGSQQGAVVVNVVQGSPADTAGIEPGDVITSVDDKKARNAQDVLNQIGLVPVGKKINFTLIRDGRKLTIPAEVRAPAAAAGSERVINTRLEGVTIDEIGVDHPYYGKINGVLVLNVLRGSIAWRSGLRDGDIITSLNHESIDGLAEFLRMVDNYNEPMLLRIVRGNSAAFLVIK
jgi:serine protease Do/serine protease DegQ